MAEYRRDVLTGKGKVVMTQKERTKNGRKAAWTKRAKRLGLTL